MTAATITQPRPAQRQRPVCRVLRYGRYEDTVTCSGCGAPFLRAKTGAYTECLRCEGARRLAVAGISPGDPALAQWAAWNDAIARRRRS